MPDDPAPPAPESTPADELDQARRPDPGSRGAARVAWVVLVVAFLVVAGLQAATALLRDRDAAAVPTGPAPVEPLAASDDEADDAPPPPEPLFEMVSKLTVATSTNLQPVQNLDELRETAKLLGGFARSDADRVRVAIVTAELGRQLDPAADVALERLEAIEPSTPGVGRDIETLSSLWTGAAVSAADETLLVQRYGFFGELALAWPRAEEASAEVIDRLGGLLAVFAGATVGGGLLLALGLLLLLMALVLLAMGKFERRFVPPAIGGSVYLEAAAVFVAGFLLLKGVLVGVAFLPLDATGQTLVALGLQWLLLLAVLWPLVRGERLDGWMRATGLHRGDGFIKEVFLGVVGWIAAVPVFMAAGLLTAGLVALWQLIAPGDGEARPLPDTALLDVIASGDVWLTAAVFTLATIWAPLAEELIFRGCLYRHLRSRLNVPISSVLIAVMFGFMHGYGVLFVPPVIALGLCFALMREWRGSLIAAITAHLAHNATLVTLMIVIMQLLG